MQRSCIAEAPSKWKLDIVSASRYSAISHEDRAEQSEATDDQTAQAEYAEALKQSVLALAPIAGVSGFWQEEIANRLSLDLFLSTGSNVFNENDGNRVETPFSEIRGLEEGTATVSGDALPEEDTVSAPRSVPPCFAGLASWKRVK